jgi:D-alanyl-D-alanine-carboxypeptidase/D-alanyl-D-alanine-endopeptidase
MKVSGVVIIVLLIVGMLVAGCTTTTTPGQGAAEWRKTAEGHFKTLSKEGVDRVMLPLIANGTHVGIVVGLVDRDGYMVYGYGSTTMNGTKVPDADTVFEIGSVTKTFTGLLLADGEERGIVNLSAPISQYLPPGSMAPTRNGRAITLTDLATHTSGLPGVPDYFFDIDMNATFAEQIREAMFLYNTSPPEKAYGWLSNYTLTRDIGARWEYSNIGTALAGDIIGRANGKGYGGALRDRILVPLGMDRTGIAPTDAMRSNMATGYRAYAPVRDEAVFIQFNDFWAGTGGIRSTGRDMVTYLGANAGLFPSPLDRAMTDSRRPRILRSEEPVEMYEALFWDVILTSKGTIVCMKGGETNGYQASVVFVRDEKIGVVVLANTAYINTPTHVQEQAMDLLSLMREKEREGR